MTSRAVLEDHLLRDVRDDHFLTVGSELGELRVVSGHLRHSHVSSVTLDTLTVSRIDGGPVSLTWKRIDAQRQQRYLFCFIAGGSTEITDDARRSSIHGAGLHVVVPGQTTVAIEIGRRSRAVFFSFHRSDVAPLMLDETLLSGRSGTSSPIYQVAFGYLWALASLTDAASSAPKEALSDLTRHTARSLMQAFHTSSTGDLDLHGRARRLIDRDHAYAGIGIQHIASELCVSRRTLERVFSARGESVAEVLRVARINHAVALMRSRPDLLFDVVARESGFGSVASLRRSVMLEHGLQLSQLRKQLQRERENAGEHMHVRLRSHRRADLQSRHGDVRDGAHTRASP
ncbi:hypothetical protein MICRO8M_50120 [Microbacterium sp. 8M]|uniref:AraC family transcriptional regulator n=1 Tax=Microbacterium sp. 8M TaxID=2653153 RepID=UPI0012F2FC96|nr:AraC family transcriptional regulator [Microbacterium sp. 8M]VXB73697.1 hypothetical protein MICRO8M_50120 [Microbacterium sp. 8M]